MSLDSELLRRMIAEDAYGLLDLPVKAEPITEHDRLVASFREITEFVAANGRRPERNPASMTEMRLAMRLAAMISSDDQRSTLSDHDELRLLQPAEPPTSLEEALADDPHGLLAPPPGDIFDVSRLPRSVAPAEEVARREPCEDFAHFEQRFRDCHADLRRGIRSLVEFKNPKEIRPGRFFVQNGVLLYVDAEGDRTRDGGGRTVARLRVIYDNATESSLLLQSLAANLYKDGRSVTDTNTTTLEAMTLKVGTPTGVVYVLRSLSESPEIRGVDHLHKIGSTSRTPEQRIAGSARHVTFLNGPVEVLAEYEVPQGAESKVEHLLHRIFATARLDIWFEKHGKTIAEANEWFSVPLEAIDEAMQLIQAGTITQYEYDRDERRLRLRRTN